MLDEQDYNLLIQQKIFTREEIKKYQRSLKITGKHWQLDASPLWEMRQYLRAGISAYLIYLYAGAIAQQYPCFELHEYYEEKIKEELIPIMEMENILEETNYYLENLVGLLTDKGASIFQNS